MSGKRSPDADCADKACRDAKDGPAEESESADGRCSKTGLRRMTVMSGTTCKTGTHPQVGRRNSQPAAAPADASTRHALTWRACLIWLAGIRFPRYYRV